MVSVPLSLATWDPESDGCPVFETPWSSIALGHRWMFPVPPSVACRAWGLLGLPFLASVYSQMQPPTDQPWGLLLGPRQVAWPAPLHPQLPVVAYPLDSGFVSSGFNHVNLWCLSFENTRVGHIWGSPFCPTNRARLLSAQRVGVWTRTRTSDPVGIKAALSPQWSRAGPRHPGRPL